LGHMTICSFVGDFYRLYPTVSNRKEAEVLLPVKLMCLLDLFEDHADSHHRSRAELEEFTSMSIMPFRAWLKNQKKKISCASVTDYL